MRESVRRKGGKEGVRGGGPETQEWTSKGALEKIRRRVARARRGVSSSSRIRARSLRRVGLRSGKVWAGRAKRHEWRRVTCKEGEMDGDVRT